MDIKGSSGPSSAFARALPAVSILLGLLAISSALERSAAVGRLSLPPYYDDIAYVISGFELYSLYVNEGFSAVFLPLLHQHAPFQSLLAMMGDFLFGVGPWSAYLANGFLAIGIIVVLLVFTRALPAIARFAIIVYVLSLPLIGNLVTEFRPDIFWGILCGIAIYLILSPTFLRSPVHTYTPAIAVGFALLAKPSAFPATAALMGFTGLMAIWLQRPVRQRLASVAMCALLVVVVAGPFFVINAGTLYHYIHLGLVEQYGIYDDLNRSFWTNASFYTNASLNQFTLSTALWFGIILFIWNSAVLSLCGWRDELIRYVCFGLATFAAYLIPTISPIKSVFFGSIFYGTFLFLTVRGLVLAFYPRVHPGQPAQRWFELARVVGPPLLIFVSIITFHGWPLMSGAYSKQFPEWNKASEHLTAALEKEVVAARLPRPAIVFVTAPYPVTDANVTLVGLWRSVQMQGDAGYYLTSLNEEKQRALQDDYVLISQKDDVFGRLPGAKIGLTLLKWIENSHDFEQITDFKFADGSYAFLFRKLPSR